MLESAKIISFIPTTDYERARAFYIETLGFQFVSLDQFALVVSVGANKIRITKIPNFSPLQGTTLGWEVQDIALVAKWLASRGVPTENIQDRDGDILGIAQHV